MTTLPPAPAGRLITLEGGEGAGKSTQLTRLAARLRAEGKDVVTTREPGGTPGAEAVRALFVEGDTDRWSAAAEACLVNAARADHVERLIRPALAAGKWVVCDRFVDSTLAYQGAGKGLADSALRNLHHIATADLWPDLTLILDISVEAGLARAAARRGGEGRFEGHELAFHLRVAHGFREIAAAEPHRCKLIDGGATQDAVAAAIWTEVEILLHPAPPAHPGGDFRAPPDGEVDGHTRIDTGDD